VPGQKLSAERSRLRHILQEWAGMPPQQSLILSHLIPSDQHLEGSVHAYVKPCDSETDTTASDFQQPNSRRHHIYQMPSGSARPLVHST